MKVLKFGAVWCAGCLVMKPRWKEIEGELPWLVTEYHDADEDADLVRTYDIQEFPCFIFLDQDGREIERLSGEVSKEKLLQVLNALRER